MQQTHKKLAKWGEIQHLLGGVLRHILSPLHNLSPTTKCAPLTAHFVAPCTHCHPKTTKYASVHGTFCRPWESTGPGRTVRIYTMLPHVWCIASALRQAFPNWPWKLYCILIKEVVDSWNYLFIIYGRMSSMLLHWIPSKQDWINVGLAGNSFAPIRLDLPNNWNRKARTISKEMKILDLLSESPDAYT